MSTSEKPKKGNKRVAADPNSPDKGSTTILTQDPKVKGGTIVPSNSSYSISSPGTIIICGSIALPGQSFSMDCGVLGTVNDTKGNSASVNTSGVDGQPPPPQLQPAPTGVTGFPGDPGNNDGQPGGRGSDGAPGTPGNSGGNGGSISISASKIAVGTKLSLIADGGKGGKGQKGQMGGNGGRGGTGLGAGGAGGAGGLGGPGGNGGAPGVITCPPDSTGAFIISRKPGPAGDKGDRGDPGSPGPTGPPAIGLGPGSQKS